MNQHKDLLYRQKYATYQLNNRTFSTQNTKISARSLAISYICFQVRIVKKKRGGKPYYQLLRKIWWLPHPRPPTRALYAKLQREKLHFLSLLTTILKALICWKLESFRGLRPLGPRQGPYGGPLDPTRMRRALRAHTVRYAHGFFRPPLFLQILDPPLYTSPLARPSRLPPEASILAGGAGEQSPPPPPQWKYLGGGQTYRFAPPPPIISSTWKIDNM